MLLAVALIDQCGSRSHGPEVLHAYVDTSHSTHVSHVDCVYVANPIKQ